MNELLSRKKKKKIKHNFSIKSILKNKKKIILYISLKKENKQFIVKENQFL